ncbi:MAG: hypothetical protein JO053_06905 [Acidobacteria bacterium]|nr:hypothetical protein [Acidobacteriota bacterium]
MKKLVTAAFAVLLLASLGYSQKRPVRKPAVKKPPVTVIPPLDVRAAREKTDNQLANVNTFVDKLGNVAQPLETALADEAAGKLKPETAQKIENSKANLVASIRNLKVGLSALESDFKTKPALAKYLPSIQGITDLTTRSEDLALAGQFVSAKEPLRGVAQKLTDTLAALPK